jgi:hypothetical protein
MRLSMVGTPAYEIEVRRRSTQVVNIANPFMGHHIRGSVSPTGATRHRPTHQHRPLTARHVELWLQDADLHVDGGDTDGLFAILHLGLWADFNDRKP